MIYGNSKAFLCSTWENGAGTCINGNSETNAFVAGTSAASDIAGIRFTVGVPFELNHANPLTAHAPLNQSAMHWHWRSGYKFLRAGVVTETDGNWLHLGSTGCQGEIRNIHSCDAPNRVAVELPDFDPASEVVALDLADLFAGIDLGDGRMTGCSSSPAEVICAAPFAALGLTFGTEEADKQTVFRARQ